MILAHFKIQYLKLQFRVFEQFFSPLWVYLAAWLSEDHYPSMVYIFLKQQKKKYGEKDQKPKVGI